MEIEWERIKLLLVDRLDAAIDDISNDVDGTDGSVCGWFPADISLRMAEAALAVLIASKSGQDELRDQEIGD